MKTILLSLFMIPFFGFGQAKNTNQKSESNLSTFIKSVDNLTLTAAFELSKRATASATALNKTVSIAILDASGTVMLLTRGDNVGPHNTEASRRKAFTALSTKTATLALMRTAASNPDAQNLNSLPELLLLSGGVPIWYKNNIIGSIGVSGGGSAENDDLIAKSAEMPEIGITTIK